MACCAFAVFLLSQLLLPFERVRALLFGEKAERDNPAAAWTFGIPSAAITPSFPSHRRRFAHALALAAGVELVFVAGAVAFVSTAQTPAEQQQAGMSEKAFLDALHNSICRTFGATNATSIP
jgi:hypothetical protein